MKSKFFKVILPAFAIMLAIGLSSFTVNSDIPGTGYYYDGANTHQETTDCTLSGTSGDCTIIVAPFTYQLYDTAQHAIDGDDLGKLQITP